MTPIVFLPLALLQITLTLYREGAIDSFLQYTDVDKEQAAPLLPPEPLPDADVENMLPVPQQHDKDPHAQLHQRTNTTVDPHRQNTTRKQQHTLNDTPPDLQRLISMAAQQNNGP